MHRNARRVRNGWLLVASVGLLAVGCTKPDAARPVLAGSELFRDCTTCHGQDGTGNAQFKTPQIAGLPAWYVEAQLVKFQTGARGAHPDDVDGLRMRPMSRQLMNRAEVKAVSEYIATLKPVKAAPSLTGGDATAGAAAFATCMACHGPTGQGNQAVNAPPLAGQMDWYLLAQLKKFKAGVRGNNPLDATGGTMRPMAMTLADEQAMKNVIAHISTLNR